MTFQKGWRRSNAYTRSGFKTFNRAKGQGGGLRSIPPWREDWALEVVLKPL
jgi:hypothetical protein